MRTAHSTRHEELLPAYALGALDGDDLRDLEEHLATACAECRRQLDLWQGDLEELATSVPPVTPSPVTRRRILRLARASRPSRPVLRWLALPAAALLALAAWSSWQQVRLDREVERLVAERDLLTRQVASLERELGASRAELARVMTILAAPGSRSVQLAGLGPTPGASGHTFIDPRRGKALFYAFHLPALTPDKTYQLWWIGGQGPVSAGTFAVDAQGSARVEVDRIAPPGEIQLWAVTIEPQGGVPQPTGAMVLKG